MMRKGPKQTARTPENIAAVRAAFQHSPTRSARNYFQALGMSDRIVRRILHLDFPFQPYSVQVQELSDRDKASRLQFCNEFQGLLLQNPNFIYQLVSDKASFHLCGAVNKQNFLYCSETNPQQMHEPPLYNPKVVARCGIAPFGIYGPIFL
jgi:hypothetical protein